MQLLRSSLTTHRRWWLLGSLGLLVGLGALLGLLRACQAQPASPARAPAPISGAGVTVVNRLTWDYTPAAPERFVVRRSIEGGAWQDVGVLPGASGTGLAWNDTTLPASEAPITVKYVVYAVVGTGAQAKWSEASDVAVTTVGLIEPVVLGECVLTQPQKKRVTINCRLP